MAVKIESEILFAGKIQKMEEYRTVPSGRLVTSKEKQDADEIDRILGRNCKKIVNEMNSEGLIKKGTKKGSLDTWYKLGTNLNFIDDLPVREQERKWIYKALHHHFDWINSGKADREHPEHSHYSKCHQIAKLPWEKVKVIGNWSQWYPLLENAFFAQRPPDTRLMDWLYERILENDERIKGWPTNKSRLFNKNLRRAFQKGDAKAQAKMVKTKDIPDNELYALFEAVADETHTNFG